MEAGFPFLAFAEAEVLHEFGGGVSEPGGDGLIHGFSREILGFIPSVGGGAGFFGESESYGGVGEHEAGFGHADSFYRLETGGGKGKSAVSGEADIFGSKNYHAAGDKFGIFAGIYHPC